MDVVYLCVLWFVAMNSIVVRVIMHVAWYVILWLLAGFGRGYVVVDVFCKPDVLLVELVVDTLNVLCCNWLLLSLVVVMYVVWWVAVGS